MREMKDPMYRVAEFMAISAQTAPKALGRNFTHTKIVTGEELNNLADAMIKFGEKTGKKDFDRDSKSVRNSDAVLLISLLDPDVIGLDCGACGFEKCEDMKKAKKEGPEFKGPNCVWRLLDLGIALGSAAKTASLFNADSRIMYRAGVVARETGLIEGDLTVGIPISATGKNIYFDR